MRHKSCQEPRQFAAADRLLSILRASYPAGANRRELQTAFRVVGEEFHYLTDSSGMQLLHLLEFAGDVVVHRDGPKTIRLVRVRNTEGS